MSPSPDGPEPLDPTVRLPAPAPDDPTRVRDTPPAHAPAAGGAPAVAGYAIGREIGRGGMGAVYAARDPALNREVAVKVMLPGMSAAEFVCEARIVGRLSHPGIPPVHDLGELPDGRPFLVMKLIRGDTLDVRLRARADTTTDRGPLLAVFEQTCLAVGFAHGQGIVHRDLKPSNVMVGAFGEVQVMDWGLAKVLGTADPEFTAPGASGSFSGDTSATLAATLAGTVKGTPAYMAPEQARGEPVDARADVFALGGILAAILTGKPPFAGNGPTDTILRAANAELADVFERLDRCGADAELVALAKRCLAPRPEDRPENGEQVEAAVVAYRAGVDARLRQAEQDAAASEAKAVELRKRRRVQLALVGVVAMVLAGAGAATALVTGLRAADKQKQSEQQVAAEKEFADEQLRAEKKLADERVKAAQELADERVQAEQQRATLRSAADEREKRARADSLVQALESASTAEVPRLIEDLRALRDLVGPKLRELADQSEAHSKPWLHARLALLNEEPGRAGELADYLTRCRHDELMTIRRLLLPRAKAVAPDLWEVLLNEKEEPKRRARAACGLAGLAAGGLAGFAPDDPRWKGVASAVTGAVLEADPAEFVEWSAALEPVRAVLVPDLRARYRQARERIESGKLGVPELAGAVRRYDLTADLLSQYANDRPADLADLALLADPRHYPLFAPALRTKRAGVVPLLRAEVGKKPPAKLATDKLDAALGEYGKRRGYAAAALLALGEAESAWPVFAFPKDGDPTARSYLQERLPNIGTAADARALMKRFETEGDVSAQRALLVALGDFAPDKVPAAEREELSAKLLVRYREHPDPGLHGAIDWLLRQKWGKDKQVGAIDQESARETRARGPAVPKGKDWFVNGEGQTFAVIRGPVKFTMGSPTSEPDRKPTETPHQMQIGRTFAVATKEVTMAEFRRFRANHQKGNVYSPGEDTPALAVTWYDAAAYCSWLSEKEGVPKVQWCYEPNQGGAYTDGMSIKPGHLALTGYRLPTEAEWEFACRGGAATARYYGRGEELLDRYAWCLTNSKDRSWPVGQLRPNELGLFDVLGNVSEWCEELASVNQAARTEDREVGMNLSVDDRGISDARRYRGGSFIVQSAFARPAAHAGARPGYRNFAAGFRPVRTLPGG